MMKNLKFCTFPILEPIFLPLYLGLTKEGPLGVRGISDRDLSQSIDHMGLVIWNFHRFSCRPFGVELQPFKVGNFKLEMRFLVL